MKILYLTHLVPWPTNTGGKQILRNHIKRLSASHEVSLICFRQPDYVGTGGLEEWCRSLEIFDLPPRREILLNAFVDIFKDVPLPISLYNSREHAETIRERIENGGFDILICQVQMAKFIPPSHRGPKILLMEDPEPLKFTRVDKRDWTLLQRFLRGFESARLSRYEKRQAPRFDRVTLLSEEDVRDNLSFLPGARLACVPYGTDVAFFSPTDPADRVDGAIVFTGNLYHPPNVAAVNWFCREVYPLVRQEVPNAHLWVVGGNPVPEILRWGESNDITVAGSVPDIRQYLRMARVSICPIYLKIGVQTKILEAMACGTPVVTTAAGNHGIGAAPSGEGLVVADTPEDFARGVTAMLRDEKWDRLSALARRFVVDRFSWERSVEILEKLMAEVVEEHRPRATPTTGGGIASGRA
jgi:glycosyltransferase involved in cell wall biosynthesis